MNKRGLFILLLTAAVMLVAGGLAFVVLSHGAGTTTASAEPREHHGMSPALWVAIFSGVWVPLLANAGRRRREKAEADKARRDKQP